MKITKSFIYLLSFFVIAVVIRVIVANSADIISDETIYSTRAIDIIKANRLSTIDQSPLYFYLVDIGYRFFGVTVLTSRLPNIIFGSLIVFITFLLGKEIFNRRTGLIAAFLSGLSAFNIFYNIEMDIIATFFTLLSLYFFIKGLRYNKDFFIYSAIFLGLGILNKISVALVLPAYLIYFISFSYKHPEKSIINFSNKKATVNVDYLRVLLISTAIIIFMLSPIIVYNYLLYKEKGVVDVIISRYVDVDTSVYGGLQGVNIGWTKEHFLRFYIGKPMQFFKYDGLIFALFILGLSLSFIKKKETTSLLFLMIMIPYLFLVGTSGVSVHYVFFFGFFSIFAAYFTDFIINKIKFKYALLIILILMFVTQILLISKLVPPRAGTLKLMDYVTTIPKNSLVLVDSRIYRGRIAFVFNDQHYLESNYFNQVLNQIENLPGEVLPLEVYFVECVNNDCGWGQGIKQNKAIQDLNENLVLLFKNSSVEKKEIRSKDFNFNIYRSQLNLKPAILQLADSTHSFYFYPVRWKIKEQIFDYYEPKGFDKFLDFLGHLSLWLSFIIALISPLFLLYIIIKKS